MSLAAQQTSQLLTATTAYSVHRSTESRFLCQWLHSKLHSCLLLPRRTAIYREQVSMSLAAQQTSQLLTFTTAYSDQQRAGFYVIGCTANFTAAYCYHSVQRTAINRAPVSASLAAQQTSQLLTVTTAYSVPRSTESRFLCHWLQSKLHSCLLLPHRTAYSDRQRASFCVIGWKTNLTAAFCYHGVQRSTETESRFLCHWLLSKLHSCLLLPRRTAIYRDREQVSVSLAGQRISQLESVSARVVVVVVVVRELFSFVLSAICVRTRGLRSEVTKIVYHMAQLFVYCCILITVDS